MSFDYFYGQQSDLFTFYRVPKVLFTNERFWNISADAKMLYGILLDRMSLSAKNGWIDKNGRVYIIFTIDEAKMALNCAEQKAIKLLSELEKKAGLIERKRQGLGKPNLIYVKNFISAVDGKWLPKARKVYDLDENGERIRLPSGNWKSHKEDTVDWNEQYHGQEWRTGWETVQNRYLEMVNSPIRVDLRSYEKQGLDILPTVHMGAAVTQMERRGIQTNIGNLNRDIKAANRMMSVIRSTIQNLRDWISDILEARKELLAEKKPENASPDLINLLRDYLNLRKAERRDWSRYGQQKGATKDLQSFVNATNYLKDHEIFTLEQLDSVLEEVKQKSGSISTGMRKAESRMKVITGIQNAAQDCQQHKAVHDKYVRIGWKTVQSVYAESHRDELDTYNKAYRFLKKHGVDLNVDLEALQAEYEQLQTSHAEYTGQLAAVQEELKPLKEIRYWVSKVLSPEQAEVKKKPEPKHSVTEQIQDYREESRKKDEQHRQEKKQNMER